MFFSFSILTRKLSFRRTLIWTFWIRIFIIIWLICRVIWWSRRGTRSWIFRINRWPRWGTRSCVWRNTRWSTGSLIWNAIRRIRSWIWRFISCRTGSWVWRTTRLISRGRTWSLFRRAIRNHIWRTWSWIWFTTRRSLISFSSSRIRRNSCRNFSPSWFWSNSRFYWFCFYNHWCWIRIKWYKFCVFSCCIILHQRSPHKIIKLFALFKGLFHEVFVFSNTVNNLIPNYVLLSYFF